MCACIGRTVSFIGYLIITPDFTATAPQHNLYTYIHRNSIIFKFKSNYLNYVCAALAHKESNSSEIDVKFTWFVNYTETFYRVQIRRHDNIMLIKYHLALNSLTCGNYPLQIRRCCSCVQTAAHSSRTHFSYTHVFTYNTWYELNGGKRNLIPLYNYVIFCSIIGILYAMRLKKVFNGIRSSARVVYFIFRYYIIHVIIKYILHTIMHHRMYIVSDINVVYDVCTWSCRFQKNLPYIKWQIPLAFRLTIFQHVARYYTIRKQ